MANKKEETAKIVNTEEMVDTGLFIKFNSDKPVLVQKQSAKRSNKFNISLELGGKIEFKDKTTDNIMTLTFIEIPKERKSRKKSKSITQ